MFRGCWSWRFVFSRRSSWICVSERSAHVFAIEAALAAFCSWISASVRCAIKAALAACSSSISASVHFARLFALHAALAAFCSWISWISASVRNARLVGLPSGIRRSLPCRSCPTQTAGLVHYRAAAAADGHCPLLHAAAAPAASRCCSAGGSASVLHAPIRALRLRHQSATLSATPSATSVKLGCRPSSIACRSYARAASASSSNTPQVLRLATDRNLSCPPSRPLPVCASCTSHRGAGRPCGGGRGTGRPCCGGRGGHDPGYAFGATSFLQRVVALLASLLEVLCIAPLDSGPQKN